MASDEVVASRVEYMSDRNIPLYLSRYTRLHEKPIVTVEDYLKWYSVFVIMPNGGVVKASDYFPEWHQIEREFFVGRRGGATFYGDHVWQPYGIVKFAEKIGGHVDEDALAAITLRWLLEYKNSDLSEL